MAPLLNGFPQGTIRHRPTRWWRSPRTTTTAEQRREHAVAARRSPLQRQPLVLRALPVQRRRGRHARPHGHARAACSRKQQPQNLVGNCPEHLRTNAGQRVQGRAQPAADQRDGVRPGRLRPDRRVAVGHVHVVVDRRARHHRHRPQRPPDPRHAARRRRSARCSTRGRSRSSTPPRWTRGAHTFKGGFEYRSISSQFQFLGSNELSYNSITDFIDNRPERSTRSTADSPFFEPQQFYLIGFVQDSWRAGDRLTLELGLRYDYYSVVKENGRSRQAVLRRGERLRRRRQRLLQRGQEQLLAASARRPTR